MPDHNLILNMVTFNHPVEVKEFDLVREEFNEIMRLDKSSWPVDLIELYREMKKIGYFRLQIFSQQNLPATNIYPEMVAGLFPSFESEIIPPFGKDNIWFL